ncbi:HAD family hydrolase [Texcoconibacillus texcoconensis]|uniref:Haloacid dehalogenase n=1 Tax=Texcoconibacillus texcoconensis TaxID=1095777 RepID=A0A840QPF8_9BACI|nr:HAD family hydrolase [Texcoconibacillus texcoconensis]MBB5173255.1 hypothetical protein [Texcoconibacillus texcoconensis]
MAYRLLAIDIDGTLLKSNHRLTKYTKDAIDYVKSKGVYVTLATGRSFPSAKKVAKALGVEDNLLITHDGAFIGNDSHQPVFERRLDHDSVYRVVDCLENYHCHVRLMHEKYAIGNKIREKRQLVGRVNLGIGDPLFYPVQFNDSLSHHLIDQPLTVPKIRAQFWNDEEYQDARDELKEAVPGIRVSSSAKGSLDIVEETTSKARGLRVVADHLGVNLNETVAIGCYYNDKEMIQESGLGVAMGHAPEDIQQIADWITRSNEQNGVGYMVREVFRKQLRVDLLNETK